MVDFYALPQTGERAWPGRAEASQLAFAEKAASVENALLADVCGEMGDDFDPNRFVPYVIMHEFEGLLFSDTTRVGQGIGKPELSPNFKPSVISILHPRKLTIRPKRLPLNEL